MIKIRSYVLAVISFSQIMPIRCSISRMFIGSICEYSRWETKLYKDLGMRHCIPCVQFLLGLALSQVSAFPSLRRLRVGLPKFSAA